MAARKLTEDDIAEITFMRLVEGRTQAEIAEKFGVHQSRVSQIMNPGYKPRLNERRRERYREDPEYRAKVRERAEQWLAENVERRRELGRAANARARQKIIEDREYWARIAQQLAE